MILPHREPAPWVHLALASVLALVFASTHILAQVSDGCPSGFTGVDRKVVKNRSLNAGSRYPKLNGGSIVYAKKWFDLACAWDPNLPTDATTNKPAYKAKVIDGVENRRVKLRGYLVGFKKDDDIDFHVEIAEKNNWDSRHLVVELPSTSAHCAARQKLIDLMKADIQQFNATTTGSYKFAFHKAVCVEVEGFTFLDLHHLSSSAVACQANGNRGMRPNGQTSKVVGLYEVHPVFSVKKAKKCVPSCGAGMLILTSAAPHVH